MAKQPRLMRDIQANARHLTSGDVAHLLSFYSDIETETDSLGSQYVPLTAVKTWTPKLFAIGIIPPQIAVTGRALDRSVSVAANEDALPILPNSPGGPTLDLESQTLAEAVTAGVPLEAEPFDPKKNRINTNAWKSHPDSFWIAYVSMCDRLQVDPIEMGAVLWNESNLDPGSYNPDGPAKGLNQLTPAARLSLGMDNKTWENYQNLSAEEQLVWVEKYYGSRVKGKKRGELYRATFGGFNNPDGSLYAKAEAQKSGLVELEAQLDNLRASNMRTKTDEIKRLEERLAKGYEKAEYQDKAYHINKALDKDGNGRITVADLEVAVASLPPTEVAYAIEAAANSGRRTGRRVEGEGNAATGDPRAWVSDGSGLSTEQRRQFDAIAGTGYNATKLGQKFQQAQKEAVEALKEQLEAMKNLPPLKMLVNPNSFAVAHTKVVTDANFTRCGPIVEHWGEEQDTITASGQIGGFYAVDGTAGDRGPGLTRMARQYSKSYQNFMALYMIYRNNAGIYVEDHTGQGLNEKRRNLSLLGSIYIFYDNTLYVGSFENFNITETADKPFSLEYNYSFKVRASYLLDEPVDPLFTYGIAGGDAAIFVNEQAPTLPSQQRAEELQGYQDDLKKLGDSNQKTSELLIDESPQPPQDTVAIRNAALSAHAEARRKFEIGSISLAQYDYIVARNPLPPEDPPPDDKKKGTPPKKSS